MREQKRMRAAASASALVTPLTRDELVVLLSQRCHTTQQRNEAVVEDSANGEPRSATTAGACGTAATQCECVQTCDEVALGLLHGVQSLQRRVQLQARRGHGRP